jgi:predicted RNase H-like HicB family nuclease
MAGTMPHAIFIEPDVDGPGTFAAYAAELPGCAVFAASDEEAAARMPQRVTEFTGWLRARGEAVPAFVGDNWYEVERAPSTADATDGRRRAAFSLDELSPSDEEFGRWMRWLELSREELADALDAGGESNPDLEEVLSALAAQDLALARQLGGGAPAEIPEGDPVDRLYAARDLLTDALAAAGPTADGVRRALRLAIADDLRLAAELRGGTR